MGTAGRLFTDFFVFTFHGHFLQRIKFDKNFWLSMVNKFEWFWTNCLADELPIKQIKQAVADSEKQCPSCAPHQSIRNMSSEVIRKDIPSVSSTNFNSTSKPKSTKSVAVGSIKIKTVQQKRKGKSKDQIYKRTNTGNVYLCGNCQIHLPDYPSKYEEERIVCDSCPLWYHKKCVGIKRGQSTSGKWICRKCS